MGDAVVDGQGRFRSYDACVVVWDCGAHYGSVVFGSFFVFSLISITDSTEENEEEEEDGANKGSTDSDDFVACRRIGDYFSDG